VPLKQFIDTPNRFPSKKALKPVSYKGRYAKSCLDVLNFRISAARASERDNSKCSSENDVEQIECDEGEYGRFMNSRDEDRGSLLGCYGWLRLDGL
jgi:hypothetical protein